MEKVIVSQEAANFIRKMADEVENKAINKIKEGIMSFEDTVVELLVEIKRRLTIYGINDTEQTIRIICEGIDNFIKRHKLK